MNDFLAKARPGRSVLERTRVDPKLPKVALYQEWLGGQRKRRLLDPEGTEHLVDDEVVQRSFKLATGAKSKKLLEEHWPDALKKGTTIRHDP